MSEQLFRTFNEAEAAGSHALAARWADVTRRPVAHAAGTVDMEIDEVATMAALARWLTRWLPINIHRALLAGATVQQVAAAADLSPEDVYKVWREWADGQRYLQSQIPGLPDHTAEYDRVQAILATGPATP